MSDTMTKQHFEAIAAAISDNLAELHRQYDLNAGNSHADYYGGGLDALEETACDLADTLEAFNQSFDHERFLTACGVANQEDK